MDYNQRLENVNLLLKKISSLGRNFFQEKEGSVSYFKNVDGFPVFIDSYRNQPCALLPNLNYIGSPESKKDGFESSFIKKYRDSYKKLSHGSGLRHLLSELTFYILTDIPPSSVAVLSWGYSEKDVNEINKYASEIGIDRRTPFNLLTKENTYVFSKYGCHLLVHEDSNGQLNDLTSKDTSLPFIQSLKEKLDTKIENQLNTELDTSLSPKGL